MYESIRMDELHSVAAFLIRSCVCIRFQRPLSIQGQYFSETHISVRVALLLTIKENIKYVQL